MDYTCKECHISHNFGELCPTLGGKLVAFMKKWQFLPLYDKVVVLQDPEKERAGVIYIPDNVKTTSTLGTVVWVGPGRDGHLPVVKTGDRVLFGRYAGVDYDTGEDLIFKLMREDEIICTIQKV